jgi:YHS domain-containing protein
MADISSLTSRLDAEIAGAKRKIKLLQTELTQAHKERQARLEQFERLITELADLWRPRLEALRDRFGDQVQVKPQIGGQRREAVFAFQSEVANIKLRLSASTDIEVRNLVLAYDLEIIPVLIKYNAHQSAEWPLDAVDRDAVAAWIDDRLIEFVHTYFSLHENEHYLKDHLVEDPIARIRFPRFAAAATSVRDGQTYHFISKETKEQFESGR